MQSRSLPLTDTLDHVSLRHRTMVCSTVCFTICATRMPEKQDVCHCKSCLLAVYRLWFLQQCTFFGYHLFVVIYGFSSHWKLLAVRFHLDKPLTSKSYKRNEFLYSPIILRGHGSQQSSTTNKHSFNAKSSSHGRMAPWALWR